MGTWVRGLTLGGMDLLPLAAAQELVFLGAALAVALLLVIQLRISKRFRVLELEVERLKKAHKDGSLDARSRVEDATRALEALEESVAPKLAAFEPHLLEVGARVDELTAQVAPLVPALEAAGRRETEASEVLADAQTRLEQAEESARAVADRFGVMEEGVRDAQGRLEQTEHGLDRLRTAFDERLNDLDHRVGELQTIPAAAPRQPTRTALGLAERRTARTESQPAADDGEDEADAEPVAAEAAEAADTADADREADMSPGMRGVLIGVVVLAVVTILLRWAGVGR